MHICCLACLPGKVKSEKPRSKKFYKIEKSKIHWKVQKLAKAKKKKTKFKKLWNVWILYLSRKECPNSGWDFERLKVCTALDSD